MTPAGPISQGWPREQDPPGPAPIVVVLTMPTAVVGSPAANTGDPELPPTMPAQSLATAASHNHSNSFRRTWSPAVHAPPPRTNHWSGATPLAGTPTTPIWSPGAGGGPSA